MTIYNTGEILLLRFPFAEARGAKQRPALVLLDAGDSDIVVARITTQIYSTQYDVAIIDWSNAGLLAASTVRLHKLATLEKSLVKRQLGRLTKTDSTRISAQLSQLFVSFS